MEVVALLISCIAALAAVGAWLVAVNSAESARDSAKEAKKANHLAMTPDVQITSDGTVGRGVETKLTVDRDLDSLRIELLQPPSQSYDRGRFLALSGMFINQDGDVGVEYSDGQRALELSGLRAGQVYSIALQWVDTTTAYHCRADFRMTARLGDDEWVLGRSIDSVELRFHH